MVNAFFDEDSYKLYIKQTKQFITNKLNIVFILDYNFKNIVYLDILKNIFLNGPKDKTTIEFLTYLEQLYDTNFSIENERIGNSILINFNISFLNHKFIKKNEFEKLTKLIFDVINKPKITNNMLDKAKNNLLNNVLLNKDDTALTNIKKSLNYIDNNIFFDNQKYIDCINDINIKSIVDFYHNFLEQTKKYIYYMGNYDKKTVYDVIKKYCTFKSIQTKSYNYYLNNYSYKRCKNISKGQNYNYLDIVQIYTYYDLSNYQKSFVLPIFNIIIGGNLINSVIFKKLREKEGLVYGLNTFYRKYDRLLILETSLKKENYNKVIRIIRNSIKQIKKGDFDNTVLEDAKKLIIESLDSIEDNQSKIINKCIRKTILKEESIDTKINNYKKVSKKDIIKVAGKIKLIINYKSGEYYE